MGLEEFLVTGRVDCFLIDKIASKKKETGNGDLGAVVAILDVDSVENVEEGHDYRLNGHVIRVLSDVRKDYDIFSSSYESMHRIMYEGKTFLLCKKKGNMDSTLPKKEEEDALMQEVRKEYRGISDLEIIKREIKKSILNLHPDKRKEVTEETKKNLQRYMKMYSYVGDLIRTKVGMVDQSIEKMPWLVMVEGVVLTYRYALCCYARDGNIDELSLLLELSNVSCGFLLSLACNEKDVHGQEIDWGMFVYERNGEKYTRHRQKKNSLSGPLWDRNEKMKKKDEEGEFFREIFWRCRGFDAEEFVPVMMQYCLKGLFYEMDFIRNYFNRERAIDIFKVDHFIVLMGWVRPILGIFRDLYYCIPIDICRPLFEQIVDAASVYDMEDRKSFNGHDNRFLDMGYLFYKVAEGGFDVKNLDNWLVIFSLLCKKHGPEISKEYMNLPNFKGESSLQMIEKVLEEEVITKKVENRTQNRTQKRTQNRTQNRAGMEKKVPRAFYSSVMEILKG